MVHDRQVDVRLGDLAPTVDQGVLSRGEPVRTVDDDHLRLHGADARRNETHLAKAEGEVLDGFVGDVLSSELFPEVALHRLSADDLDVATHGHHFGDLVGDLFERQPTHLCAPLVVPVTPN